MGRKSIEINSLHEYELKELIEMEKDSSSKYSRGVLRTVIMRYQGVKTMNIAEILGKSLPCILKYIHNWNHYGMDAIFDWRGGSKATFTQEMKESVKHVVLNHTPKEYGYEISNWNTKVLVRYIKEKYQKEYSSEWLRLVLKELGFSYKRGCYKPSKANPLQQEEFKKNEFLSGIY